MQTLSKAFAPTQRAVVHMVARPPGKLLQHLVSVHGDQFTSDSLPAGLRGGRRYADIQRPYALRPQIQLPR